MKFNSYIWELYKTSEAGKEVLDSLKIRELDADLDDLSRQLVFAARAHAQQVRVNSDEDALAYIESIASGLPLTSYPVLQELFGDVLKADDILHNIYLLSSGWYLAHSDFFLPYDFSKTFDLLESLSGEFGFSLPPVPNRSDIKGRVRYYGLVNQTWHEFRRSNNLDPAEMIAFLYDFAQNFFQTEPELPAPSKVWLLIGGAGKESDFETLDNAQADTQDYWQANLATRRGDVLVMYCKSPRSYIHSIWRAVTDGFADPFFYYQNLIWIGHPVKVPPVHFKEMQAHSVLKENRYMRANLQGASGKPLTLQEYEAILELLKNKGFDGANLPRPEGFSHLPDLAVYVERDVEEKLVEPLLTRLGYTPDDWLRQMPLRMGRGERFYPDYAFFPVLARGEDKAKMVLETKYRIVSQRALRETYTQARSYSQRLQAHIMVLAALDGLWVFPKTNSDFSFDNVQVYHWKDLEQPDTFHELLQRLGRDVVAAYRA